MRPAPVSGPEGPTLDSVESPEDGTTEGAPEGLTPPEGPPEEQPEGPGMQWTPLQDYAAMQSEEIRLLLTEDFWLSPAWAVTAPGVVPFLLVSTQEQAEQLRPLNAVLVAAQARPVPVWGPDDLRRYVGDLLVLMDVEAQARLAVEIQRATLEGTQWGAQNTIGTIQSQALLVPVWVGRLQGLATVAREMLGKSLIQCSDEEHALVQTGLEKLLLAVREGRPLRTADMPRLPTPEPPPATEKPQREPGQYL